MLCEFKHKMGFIPNGNKMADKTLLILFILGNWMPKIENGIFFKHYIEMRVKN